MSVLRTITLAAVAFVFATTAATAQGAAQYLGNADQTYGDHFFDQPAGTVGIITVRACGRRGALTGRHVYIMQSNQIYWGSNADCVRVVVNHQNTNPGEATPTYLGVQIIGLYDSPQSTAVILRRRGTFTRDQKPLPEFEDAELAPEQLSQQRFNELHSAPPGSEADRALHELDQTVGAPWHGTPDGGTENSWDRRFWFRATSAYDNRISLRHKVLENRLIRFTPYPAKGHPNDGPVKFDVHRKGAGAAVIRLFSPSNSDIEHNFALIYATDAKVAAGVINIQVAGGQWWQWW